MTCLDDFSLIEISCLSENLEETLKLLSKLIEDPLLTGVRINRIKETMNQSRKVNEDDPGYVSTHTFYSEFFQDTSYGPPFLGSEESLKTIKKKDIENYYKKHFIKENMVFILSTNLEKEKVIPWLEKHFDDFDSGSVEIPESISFTLPENKTFDLEKDSQQTLVSYAVPLPESNPPQNYILAYLTNNLLGQGPNSRLWPLRMEKKLAYNVSSRFTQMKSAGLLEAYLETDQKKKAEAVKVLGKTLDDLCLSGISEEELQVTKTFSRAEFLRGHETKSARTRTLALFETLGFGCDFINIFFEEIEKITLEEINAYLKNILKPENRILVTVGPQESDKALL
jgi:predicted Zn-dependent peptidase